MFLRLWNYLRGYVMISVTGFSVERFINLAAVKNIYLWNIVRCGSGVTLSVSIHGFKALREPLKKTGCRAKILERKGFPFLLAHYQKRKILLLGILFFLAGLYVLSSFVWVVEIEGTNRISHAELLDELNELGLAPGRPRLLIDTKKVSEGLITKFSDISWVGVKITGTDAKISIVETIPEPEIIDRSTPTDIIASKDGIILSVAASAGRPVAKPKDVVKKGDILVSGEVYLTEGGEIKGSEFVHAKAKVTAKVWYQLTEELPLTYTEKIKNGEQKTDKSLVIGNTEINLIKPKMETQSFDSILAKETPFAIGDYKFPVALRQYQYDPFTEAEKTRTEEEAKTLLQEMLQKKIVETLPSETEILNTEIQYEKEGNTIKATATVIVSEQIGTENRRTENSGENP